MSEGSPVGAHVIKMMGYIQTLEKLGFALKDELATDVILQSLPDSFKPFVLNFNKNEINKTLPQLLGSYELPKSGHWKRNCPLYLEEVKKSKANGASSSEPLKRRILAKGNVDLQAGNGARVATLAVGTYISLIDLI
ncbi:hypothetical protein V6N11_011968 [Hibiscus sabdariffa]|uniref:Uncharacterized protein n=1 Tax=Hibiscus sabdariffa TaxID=183260 RepID=A0ABR2P9Y6_9ROSI